MGCHIPERQKRQNPALLCNETWCGSSVKPQGHTELLKHCCWCAAASLLHCKKEKIKEKIKLTRAEEVARKNKENCLGSGEEKQTSRHFSMFAGISGNSLTLCGSPPVCLLQALSWPAADGCAHVCFEGTPGTGCHPACICACMCMGGRNIQDLFRGPLWGSVCVGSISVFGTAWYHEIQQMLC